jgi:hypothetical protein
MSTQTKLLALGGAGGKGTGQMGHLSPHYNAGAAHVVIESTFGMAVFRVAACHPGLLGI